MNKLDSFVSSPKKELKLNPESSESKTIENCEIEEKSSSPKIREHEATQEDES